MRAESGEVAHFGDFVAPKAEQRKRAESDKIEILFGGKNNSQGSRTCSLRGLRGPEGRAEK